MKLIINILCIASFFMAQSSAAKPLPVLKVVSEEWTNYTNADGTGTYWDIVRAVYGKHYQLEFIATTWGRALNLVETGRADVLVGSTKSVNKKLIFPQHHLDIEYPVYAIFDKNIHTISTVNDLAGLTVAGRKDYGFAKFLPRSSHFYGVEKIHDVAQLIEKNRVDVALAYQVNLALADPDNRFTHQSIGPEERLYLAFTHSAKGKKLRKHYEHEIIVLIRDDQLKQYFPNEQEYQHANLDSLLPCP
jgi:polar amino acid transport system substrate-binding protein